LPKNVARKYPDRTRITAKAENPAFCINGVCIMGTSLLF